MGVRLVTTSQIIILFPCDPGTVAFGNGGNSCYSELTGALLNHIATPNLSIQQLITEVTKEVMQNTENKQRPWVHLTLTEDFFFRLN